tara:strand:+ start:1849 stop:2394 length:546 start_codon:yes stop_codon:yes gene_type:complete
MVVKLNCDGNFKKDRNVKALFIFCIALQASLYTSAPQLLHTGKSCIKKELIRLIQNEKMSIFGAMFLLKDRDIMNHLYHASSRVDVKVIVDKASACKNPLLQKLQKARIVEVFDSDGPAIMHNKFFVFGEKIVFTGSFNGTRAASLHHYENVLILENEQLAQEYLDYMYYLEQECKRKKRL